MRIMIVDDSKAMRGIVMRALRQAGYAGATFEEHANGRDALDAIRAGAPDLVLADWNMPEMTGIELLAALQSEKRHVKIGLITSETDPEMRELAMRTGASFMLPKPINADTIKAALVGVLS